MRRKGEGNARKREEKAAKKSEAAREKARMTHDHEGRPALALSLVIAAGHRLRCGHLAAHAVVAVAVIIARVVDRDGIADLVVDIGGALRCIAVPAQPFPTAKSARK